MSKPFWITVANCSEANPGGEIKEAYWEMMNGEVVITGLDHRPVGREKLSDGADPDAVARRILRNTKRNDFNRPLNMPQWTVV
jgi:hypothetical protein